MKMIVAGLASDTSSIAVVQSSLLADILPAASDMITIGKTMNTRGTMHQTAIAVIDPMIARICVLNRKPINSDSQATSGK